MNRLELLALSGHRPRVAEASAEAQALPSSPEAMTVEGEGGTFSFKTKGWKKRITAFKEWLLRSKPCQQIIVVGENTNNGVKALNPMARTPAME